MGVNRLMTILGRVAEWGTLLAIVALFVWNVPSFHLPGMIGDLRDDAAYATYARALAEGVGYVDTSQTPPVPARRYPIGYPAVLSLGCVGVSDPFEMASRMQWLQIGIGALFILASYLFMRYRAGIVPIFALPCALLISSNTNTLYFASLLVSDILFALLSLCTIALADHYWLKQAQRRWIWVGMLVGLTFLVRYYAVCLVIAVLLPLLLVRRWRSALFVGMGAAATTAPWFVYRAVVGGETYVSEVGREFVRGDASLIFNLGRATVNLFTNGVAQFFAPGNFTSGDPLQFGIAIVISGIVLLGLARWVRAGDGLLSPISGLFLLLTVGLAWMMEIGYPMYRGGLYIRYLMVAAPLYFTAVVVAWRQLPPASSRLWGHLRLAGVATTLMASLYSLPFLAYHSDSSQELARSEWEAAYRYVQTQTPRDAALLCWSGHALAFYSKRPVFNLPLDTQYDDSSRRYLNPAVFGALMHTAPVQYIFCSPQLVPAAIPYDLTPRMIRNFDMRYPEVLKVVFKSEAGRLAVCEIDRKRLARYIQAGD